MTAITQRIELSKEWCKAHNFPYKIIGNTFYWQTAIQTAELNEEYKTITWHNWNYFLNLIPDEVSAS